MTAGPRTTYKDGDPVEYTPIMGEDRWFPCEIASDPWILGQHTEVVAIRGLPKEYGEYVGRPDKTRNSCVSVDHIRRRDG